MLDKGSSNTGKGFTKRSTSEEKLFTKSSHGEYYTYCKRPGHTKDTCYKLYGKEKVLEQMGGNKGPTLMWANQTTFDKENLVEHPSTPQLDQDIQSFSKEEINHLRALLNSTSKPLGSCGLTMKGKSYFNISSSVPLSIWILDSRVTDHMTPFPPYFTSYLKVSKNQLIIVANGDHIPIVGSGIVQLQSSLSLHNVLHVPKLANNLISIHRLIQDWNCSKLTTRRTIGVAKGQGELYYLQHTKIDNNTNKEDLSSKSVKSFKCDHHHATFSPSNNKSLEPFDLIHFNVWGPANNSILGAKMFVSFIDDCNRVTWIFLMKHKYEICQIFVNFFRLVKNQFDKSIKKLRTNNGTEFVNLEFSKFLKDNGVVHELMCLNTPQQNRVTERKNHHLLEIAKCLIFQMSVHNVYWGEAVLYATYLINKLLTRVLNGISPIKHVLSFFPSSPLMLSLPSRVFGCVAFVHSHNPHLGKLNPRAIKCVFIGYPSNKKGFKCYHSLSRQVFVSMDVTFYETQSFFVSPPLQEESYLGVESIIESLPFPTQDVQVQEVMKPTLVPKQVQLSTLEVSIPENPNEDVTDDMLIALRKRKQSCVKYHISQFVCSDHLSIQHQSFIVVIDAIKTPTS
ncbi:hypothetical protein CR513_17069, partial [Mucuna pruriens]